MGSCRNCGCYVPDKIEQLCNDCYVLTYRTVHPSLPQICAKCGKRLEIHDNWNVHYDSNHKRAVVYCCTCQNEMNIKEWEEREQQERQRQEAENTPSPFVDDDVHSDSSPSSYVSTPSYSTSRRSSSHSSHRTGEKESWGAIVGGLCVWVVLIWGGWRGCQWVWRWFTENDGRSNAAQIANSAKTATKKAAQIVGAKAKDIWKAITEDSTAAPADTGRRAASNPAAKGQATVAQPKLEPIGEVITVEGRGVGNSEEDAFISAYRSAMTGALCAYVGNEAISTNEGEVKKRIKNLKDTPGKPELLDSREDNGKHYVSIQFPIPKKMVMKAFGDLFPNCFADENHRSRQ